MNAKEAADSAKEYNISVVDEEGNSIEDTPPKMVKILNPDPVDEMKVDAEPESSQKSLLDKPDNQNEQR